MCSTESKDNAPQFNSMHRSKAQRIELSEIGVILTLPEGWNGVWVDVGLQRQYQALPNSVTSDQATLVISSASLVEGGDNITLQQMLLHSLHQIQEVYTNSAMQNGATVSWTEPEMPSIKTVSGKQIGCVTVRGVFESFFSDKTQLELYLGGTLAFDRVYTVSGNWTVTLSQQMREGANTILFDLDVKAVDTDRSAQELTGCWHRSSGSTDYGGGHSERVTLHLYPNSHYERQSMLYMSVPGIGGKGEDFEQGRWQVSGPQLIFLPIGGQPYAMMAQKTEGVLFLDGDRYIPCN